MKSIVKKIFLIIVVLMILFSINTKVFALSEIISDGQSFLQKADQSKADIDVTGLQDLSGYIYNILLAAGVVIAVIVATVLGIQFMLGGAEGQAKVKEMLVPFVVGCVIVFGGFGFWKIAMSVGEKIDNASSETSGGNQFDFTERACKSCGRNVEPKFDIDKHTYVCPKCGNPMPDPSEDENDENQFDFTQRECQSCGKNVEPVFDLDRHTYVCPSCRKPME